MMVSFKLGEEIRKDGMFNMSRAWAKKKSESPTGIKPMTQIFSLSHARDMLNIPSFLMLNYSFRKLVE